MLGIDGDGALTGLDIDPDAVQSQQVGDHLHIAYLGYVLQDGHIGRQQGRNHGLAYEVLGTTHLNGAVERSATDHMQKIVLGIHLGHIGFLILSAPDRGTSTWSDHVYCQSAIQGVGAT